MIDDHHRSEPYRPKDFFRTINIQFLIHELKGPLDVIETNIRMLLEYQNGCRQFSASQQEALRRSMRSAAKLRNIIHSLLEVGSSQRGHINLQQFNVVQCTTDVLVNALETVNCEKLESPKTNADLTDYFEANGIYLTVSPEVHGVRLLQDKTKFSYILGNLIRNSLFYKESRVMVQLMLKGGEIQIKINDDGPGIKPDDLEILFECYAKSQLHSHIQRKGHGLGLSSSRIIARCLGGDITVDPSCREGAQFMLRLPLEFNEKTAMKSDHKTRICYDER